MSYLPVFCPFCGKTSDAEYVCTKVFGEDVIEVFRCKNCGQVHGE